MFKLDTNKCIKCAKCVNDCITGAIVSDENNQPMMVHTDKCIKCQHCFAICPVGAITFNNKKPEDSQTPYLNNSEELLKLIKSRRSTRKFQKINISKDTLDKLKEMLKYTPTGCNNHKLQFSFIEDIEVMDDFRSKVNSKIINILNKQPAKFILNQTNKFEKYKEAFLNGEDIIFRDCPHMVVVSAPIDAPCHREDGIIALSYFELYANSLGIGTLWCGYAQAVLKIFPEFCEYLKIPQNYSPVYCMLFGSKDIEYKRTIQPEEYDYVTVEKYEQGTDFWTKLKRRFTNSIR